MTMEQRTAEWFLARKGKLTASEIHNILASSRKKDEVLGETAMSYIKGKVAESVMNDDVFVEMQDMAFSNAATRWGEMYEPDARRLYSGLTGMDVEENGFIPYSPHCGGSPDGMNKDGQGIIEIKCPFNSAKHVEFMLMKSPEDLLAANRQYYYQCQANLLFTGRRYVDFISYDPRMSELLNIKVLRIEANGKDFDLLKTRISIAEERLEKMVSEITRVGLAQFKNWGR